MNPAAYWVTATVPAVGAIVRAGVTVTVSETDADGADRAAMLDAVHVADAFHWTDPADPLQWWTYSVTAVELTPPAGHREFTITPGGHGPLATPADGTRVLVELYESDPVTTTLPPTRADLLAYLGTGYADPGQALDDALAAALTAQADRCVVDPYSPALYTAALRRGAAVLAATNAPLGIADLGDVGSSLTIPRWDTITETLEAAYLRPRFA